MTEIHILEQRITDLRAKYDAFLLLMNFALSLWAESDQKTCESTLARLSQLMRSAAAQAMPAVSAAAIEELASDLAAHVPR